MPKTYIIRCNFSFLPRCHHSRGFHEIQLGIFVLTNRHVCQHKNTCFILQHGDTPPPPPKKLWHLFENMMIGFDTDSPSPSISVHVAVDMQGSSGTSWVDFVDSTGACVVIAIYVITVNGKVKLGAGVDWGHKNEQSYEECLLEERKEIIAPPASTLVSCTLEKCLSFLWRKIMQIFCSFGHLLKILIFQSLYFFTCTWEKKILQYLPAFTGIFF